MLKYNHIAFPDPEKASREGLVAMGGDLSADMLISAYIQGIFPWFSENDPVLWWSPDPRMILMPDGFKASNSLLQTMRNGSFEIKFDHDFKSVITNCANVSRKGQDGTWITNEMLDAYCTLHEMGIAHSVETYRNHKLIGGLYGISLGKVFFGESMFHLVKDSSKVALFHLCRILKSIGFHFIDVQQSTKHLKSLGAKNISRSEFINKLKTALPFPSKVGNWSHLE